jgi:hypothetical protein
VPCQFQPEQARANAKYLGQMLGEEFFVKSRHPLAEIGHPILKRWVTAGVGPFLELNLLAEDLKVVQDTPGIDGVLTDLRNASRCESTWHTIHSAALLGRGANDAVLEFYPQTDERLPDFLVRNEGETVAIEAKRLATSSIEERFNEYGLELVRLLVDQAKLAAAPLEVIVVLADAEDLPNTLDLVKLLTDDISSFRGDAIQRRTGSFSVFFARPSGGPSASASYGVQVLCPRSLKEDLRVENVGKKASKQLAVPKVTKYPTMLCLALTEMQNPPFVSRLFHKRFAMNQYSGLSSVLLIRSGHHFGSEMRGHLDQFLAVPNPKTAKPLPNLALSPFGYAGMIDENASDEGIPAYRVAEYGATVSIDRPGLFMPSFRRLTTDMLAGLKTQSA